MAEFKIPLDGKTGYSNNIVAAIREIRVAINASESSTEAITPLASDADLAAVTAKVNELIAALQG